MVDYNTFGVAKTGGRENRGSSPGLLENSVRYNGAGLSKQKQLMKNVSDVYRNQGQETIVIEMGTAASEYMKPVGQSHGAPFKPLRAHSRPRFFE